MADSQPIGTLAIRAAAAVNNALRAAVTAIATVVAATSILHAAGVTMLPADPIIFLAATTILFVCGVMDYRLAVGRPGSLVCPSMSATLEAAFASVIQRPLALLTVGLSHMAFRTARTDKPLRR